MIPFPEFAPDRSKFDPSVTDYVRNVVPSPNGYSPFLSFSGVGTAVPAAPRGAIHFIDSLGDSHIFVGTETALYKWDPNTLTFTDVSGPSAPYAVANDERWSFCLFGDDVIASNKNDPVQTYTINSSTDFADLAGSPPDSRIVAVVGDHVVLGELSTQSRQVYWSGINAPAHWTVRSRGSDFQVFPDGGEIFAIIGFENGGLIIQREAIREMRRAASIPELIWEFQKVEENRGAIAPRSIASAGRDIFYLARDGFYKYGEPSIPIGRNRIDRFVTDDLDDTFRTFVEGTINPGVKQVIWRYRSSDLVSADTFLTDRVLIYDWGIDRWSVADTQLTGVFSAGSPGFTLDNLDTLGFTLDTLPFSLDSAVWAGGIPLLAGFDPDYKLGFFQGAALEATLRTNVIGLFPGQRGFVRGFRPIADAATMTGRVAIQDKPGGATTWTESASANSTTGYIPIRRPGRYHRVEATIAAGETWTHAIGVEPDAAPEGLR